MDVRQSYSGTTQFSCWLDKWVGDSSLSQWRAQTAQYWFRKTKQWWHIDHSHWVPESIKQCRSTTPYPATKHSMPMILLCNLNQAGGLCSGTQLIFDRIINDRLLQVRVAGTERYALLPRITLSPTEGTFPFDWHGHQFLIRPVFAITINKSQGKSIARVGVDLHDSVFMLVSSTLLHPMQHSLITFISVSLSHAKHATTFTWKFFHTTSPY